MKYVLLGEMNADQIERSEERISKVKTKLDELNIKLDVVYYTQGEFDFVDVVDAPDPTAVLTLSVWYARQGYGRIRTMPAFSMDEMNAVIKNL